MKFSSISLIATALAVIAGSAIAAPSPLYARAIEQVKSFEGDLDGEPVNDLSIRSVTEHHFDHSQAAIHAQKAIDTNIEAANWASEAAHWDTGRRKDWLKKSGDHRQEVNSFVPMERHHAHMATLPHGTADRDTANRDADVRAALQSTQLAKATIRAAKDHVSRDHWLSPDP